jgi:hypothetical protein
MDLSRLRTGEKIAGAAGIALILIMFIFDWYGLKGASDLGGENAWEAYSFIDIILFLAALSGIALAFVSGSQTRVNMPVALSALTAGLGILGTILVLFRIIDTPSFDFLGHSIDTSVKVGVFLGLISVAGVAYGGWRAMQEEGTTFSGERDRVRHTRASGGPPPPPSA